MKYGWISTALMAGLLLGGAGCQSARHSAAANNGLAPAVALEREGSSPTIRQTAGTDDPRPAPLGVYEDPARNSGNSWSRLMERFSGARERPVSLPRTDLEVDDVFAEPVEHEAQVSADF